MADEHFLTAGDFSSGLGTAPFLGSAGPYAPPPPLLPPGLDREAFGMLPPWAASELPLPPLPADPAAATSAHFDSALSSLVSSPGGHANGACGDDVAIGDLIGRLGSIICNTAASANNSCYSTPLSSPPRGASPAAAAAFRWGCYAHPAGAAPPLETGCAGGTMSRVASSKSLGGAAAAAALTSENAETETRASPEAAGAGSNKTEAPAGKGDGGSGAARKRKASGGKQGKTAAAVTTVNPKKSKAAGDDEDAAAEEEKKAEPVKDYIHVRARRGQATDSHSLAERVRREKISERMKLLQSLVPGCNKITGKALMLDEIINYVQSLQRQVEFLSMKLSTMNPQPLDVDAQYQLPSHSDKDMMMHYETGTAPAMLGYHQAHHQDAFSYADPFAGAAAHHPTMESCTGHAGGGVWEDTAAAGLQSVVHRRDTDQSQQHPTAGHGRFHAGGGQAAATVTTSHMKVEP